MKRTITSFLLAGIASLSVARAQTYDSLLTNSFWYVPAEYLLAFTANGTNLASTIPTVDQTIWSIGVCENGTFTGTSVAEFQIGSITYNATNTMNGIVTNSGQVRISFTNPDTPATIGVGQVRVVNDVSYMEMQMISGSTTTSFLTHWAYMAPFDGDPAFPPTNYTPLPLSTEWAWLNGTSWNLNIQDLFGGEAAVFSVDDYVNGYFWGSGTSQDGGFSFIASATPEGNLLFNVLDQGTLVSLTGFITGNATNGQMIMNTYDAPLGFSVGGSASVIPEPSAVLLLGSALGLLLFLRSRRRNSSVG